MAARLEFSGRLIKPPELRVTPRGRPVLRAWVRCDDGGQPLVLEVVLAGAAARELGGLRAGEMVWGQGELRALAGGAMRQTAGGIEVVARMLHPAQGEDEASGPAKSQGGAGVKEPKRLNDGR